MRRAAELAQAVQSEQDVWLHETQTRTRKVIKKAKKKVDPEHWKKIASGIAPYIEVPAIPLPPQRRSDFLAHLRSVIEKSFQNAPSDGPPPAPPTKDADYAQRKADELPELKILDTACIACQGECCTQGNTTHAFLTKDTINYVRWCKPDMEPDDIIEMYTSYLPEKSVRGSCVYHGDTGCTLDRPIRADICNSFQCAFRKKLAENYAEKPGYGAVVAGISSDHTEHPEAGAEFLRVVSMSEEGDVRVHSHLKLPVLKQSKSK